MAVVRITAERAWLLKVAQATVTHKRMSRELMRAASSHGHTAELTAPETRLLEALFPEDERIADAMRTVIQVEEQERVGLAAMRRRMDERRGASGT